MDQGFERHYSVYDIAELWGVSRETARRLFHKEPGVLVIKLRRNRTLRIPESVAQRVYQRMVRC